ncbi:hypothetical protein ACMU_02095 [Actibacterium mucosum KCTC 23349]|uniref:RNA polymerase sigma-54 factor n=1 Tax=Actibacterium mucosum KCTC 23349 TaxID=1454373 RepID=A0A037ZP33_9RHOB|nr:RNA polymerase factor sigma-54 [Actibacterium mucosum]KAJ57313.1 hypothetical protein ACMU_02095 [Actibacterium mucosum KCTC 23349]
MALKPGLQPKLTQRLALTPGIATSLRVLRLSSVELAEETRRLTEENPFLTRIDLPNANVFDAQTVSYEETLVQSLIRQIGMMSLPPDVRLVAEFLTGDLDDRGYLTSSVGELCALLGISNTLLTAAIDALQSCEPTGIGARNMAECLRLQLEERSVPPDEAAAFCGVLDAVFDDRWTEALQQSGLTRSRLDALAATTRNLSAYPANHFARSTEPLIPEVEIVEDPSGALTAIRHARRPGQVQFDNALAEGIGKGQSLLHQHRQHAETWMNALAFRGTTLQRISQYLADAQTRFFRGGMAEMRPLTQRHIAESLSLHPSTISRAISGKAVEHAGTVFPIAAFFSSAITTKSGEPLSSLAIQHRIRALIAAEDPQNPLSDAEIVGQLSREGVDIARRTVAKYRGCLHLPASFKRKRRPSIG